MHKKHLRWAVLGVFRCLLSTSLGKIPEYDATVIRARCQNTRIVGMPVNLGDDVLVALETVDLAMLGKPQVEDTNRLVCGSGGEELIVLGVEGQRVDGIRVCVLELHGRLAVGLGSVVHQAHGEIVGHRSPEVLAVHRMVLHVIDDRRVMCEGAGRRNRDVIP